MHKCSNNINPNYDHCGRTEDNIHLFTKCPRIKKLWTHYKPTLTTLTEKTNTPKEHLLMLNVRNPTKHTTKLTLTIIQIILYEIWESRKNNKYDKKLLLLHTIITKTTHNYNTLHEHITNITNSKIPQTYSKRNSV